MRASSAAPRLALAPLLALVASLHSGCGGGSGSSSSVVPTPPPSQTGPSAPPPPPAPPPAQPAPPPATAPTPAGSPPAAGPTAATASFATTRVVAVTVPRTTLAGLGAGATLAAALDPALREVTFFGLVRTDRDLPLRLSVPRTADTLYLELHDALGTSFRAQLPLPPETP